MNFDLVSGVEYINQNPIGKSSRSNPITYTKGYDDIRQLFASEKRAKAKGFKPGYFSFNVDGGRCEKCQGEGQLTISMQFMAWISYVHLHQVNRLQGGFKNYGYYEDAYSIEFLNLIRDFRSKNKIITSVCVGALALAKSGVLKNKNATTYNQAEYRQTLKNNGVIVSNEEIVIDNNLITSNGPSTAI